MIRVLVVEDSPVARDLLSQILSSDPTIQVVATAGNGEEALEAVERIRPDIITMDIHMPKMNGLDAARRIMETTPTPIVAVSGSFEPQEVSSTFQALEAGAVAVVRKPAGIGHPDHPESSAELLRTVKAMSEVKVIRRWARPPRLSTFTAPPLPSEPEAAPTAAGIKVIAIGASTGGPVVLQTILSRLPADFKIPILVVQHIAAGFIRGFVEWLDRSTGLHVDIAHHGEQLAGGRVYLAPDGFQMQVRTPGRISLVTGDPGNGLCPSVASLFRSVAETYGRQAVGVLLTGMGTDGAEELVRMK